MEKYKNLKKKKKIGRFKIQDCKLSQMGMIVHVLLVILLLLSKKIGV